MIETVRGLSYICLYPFHHTPHTPIVCYEWTQQQLLEGVWGSLHLLTIVPLSILCQQDFLIDISYIANLFHPTQISQDILSTIEEVLGHGHPSLHLIIMTQNQFSLSEAERLEQSLLAQVCHSLSHSLCHILMHTHTLSLSFTHSLPSLSLHTYKYKSTYLFFWLLCCSFLV